MTPEQWASLLRLLHNTADAAEMGLLTLGPLLFMYLAASRWSDIVYHFTSGDWRRRPAFNIPATPAPRIAVPARAGRTVRELAPDEPTVVMRDLPYRTAIYTTGPRPRAAVSRLRLGRIRITRETHAENPRRDLFLAPHRGRHRADQKQ